MARSTDVVRSLFDQSRQFVVAERRFFPAAAAMERGKSNVRTSDRRYPQGVERRIGK